MAFVQKYHDKEYTSSEIVSITRSDGTSDVIMRTKWTQKGRFFIYDLLKKDGIIPLIERDGKLNKKGVKKFKKRTRRIS